MSEKVLVSSICVDTLTQIQENQLAADQQKPGHDQWRDYGISILHFVNRLQELGFDICLILGEPGSGKSSGMRTLAENTNIWFNADNKNPTWTGGRAIYGKKHAPKMPYHMVPKSYADILAHIEAGMEKGMFAEDKVAFITGHTEVYKSGIETRVRLKTLGKLANKMQIEGKLEVVCYAKVKKDVGTGDLQFLLHTQNDGTNTARSNQGMLEGVMENDYNIIREAMLNY